MERILHIDSKVLEEAEGKEEAVAPAMESGVEEEQNVAKEAPAERKPTKSQQAEYLRRIVDTVGKVGQPGEKIHNVAESAVRRR